VYVIKPTNRVRNRNECIFNYVGSQMKLNEKNSKRHLFYKREAILRPGDI
jgi:hypothetical protein